MSSVLSRDLDAYQRALDQYNRSLRSYNHTVGAYNETLARGPDGKPIVVDADGNLVSGQLPEGQTPATYGRTEVGSAPGRFVLRQNPISAKTEHVEGVQYDPGTDSGAPSGYFRPTTTPGFDNAPGREWLGAEANWRRVAAHPGYTGSDTSMPETYDIERDASTYMDKPGAWTKKVNQAAPTPTKAEYQRAQMPSWAAIESGLIGEVMRGSGLKSGVAYRPAASAPQSN